MTHDRCSELLRGYVRGDLAREVADDVRDHLATCSDCRAEARAVAALAVGESADARPLDDVERARLHRGLAQELYASRANADVAGAAAPAPRSWTRWIVSAGTAAAVLAGVLVMTLGGGSDDSETGAQFGGADSGGTEDGRSVEDAIAPEAKKGRKDKQRSLTATSGQAAGAESDYAEPAEPSPAFDPDGGTLTADGLSEIGRGDLFRSFADAYRPGDGPRLYDGFLETLADEAGPQIEECAATLPQDGSLIPAYATVGEYDGQDALVLGFVTSDPGSRELDRYLMWVWAVDECDQPIDTLFEHIR